jgi:hypothetical protein
MDRWHAFSGDIAFIGERFRRLRGILWFSGVIALGDLRIALQKFIDLGAQVGGREVLINSEEVAGRKCQGIEGSRRLFFCGIKVHHVNIRLEHFLSISIIEQFPAYSKSPVSGSAFRGVCP